MITGKEIELVINTFQKPNVQDQGFISISKRVKYLGMNLIKEVKYMHTENCKTLMKETRDDTYKWQDIPFS